MSIKNRRKKLRYGENPNQNAYINEYNKLSIFDFQISGKKISYNNIIDLDSGLRCLSEFKDPTSIIMKHTNPCGVASDKNIYKAFNKSYESDTKSSFGGIIFLNRKVEIKLSKKIIKNFFEMVVAPDFENKALEILKTKKNLILLKIPNLKKEKVICKPTLFGDLYQTNDLTIINKNFIKLASKKKSSPKLIDDLLFL